jgi:ABC-type antimicrobial peptide transport system permease subunit
VLFRSSGFFKDLSAGLDAIPGARPFGLADVEPLASSRNYTGFHLPHQNDRQTKMILLNRVSAGYFDVLRIPIVAGRNFAPDEASRDIVMVNQAMANRYFPGENPIGKTIVIDKPLEIVGVARNAYTWGLDDLEPVLYTPLLYAEPPHLIVPNTPANIAAVQSLTKRLDGHVQIQITTLAANLDRSLSSSRAFALIATMLGVLALTLATIGVSGVFAYAVQQRTQEIGIRMALGARPAQVTSVVLGWAARSLIIGLAVGLAGAVLASRLIQDFLFGLSALDPITYAGVFLTLAIAGLAAAYVPARRAVRLDPIRALRCD